MGFHSDAWEVVVPELVFEPESQVAPAVHDDMSSR